MKDRAVRLWLNAAIIAALLVIFAVMFVSVRQCERQGKRALRGWWGNVECVK